MKVKLYELHDDRQGMLDVEITKAHIISDEIHWFKKYEYEFNNDFNKLFRNIGIDFKPNIEFKIENARGQYFARLNFIEKYKFYWMRSDTFIQKKFWVIMPLLISATSLIVSLTQTRKTYTLDKELRSATKKIDSLSSDLKVLHFQFLRQKEHQ